jgi:hypothetical protein
VPGVSVADSPPPPIETIIERAYFHIENGGLTLSIVEVKPGGGGTPNEYRFKHEFSMHGQTAESSFVLGSSGIVGWMNMALQRVSMKVAAIHYDGRNLLPFDKPDVTHTNGMSIEKAASLLRIVARYQKMAKEFSNPEALHEYLHEHPQADKSLHTVKRPEEHKPKPEGGHGHGHEPEGESKSWKEKAKAFGERLKTLGEKAKKFVENAPAEVKKFVQDDAHRRSVLQSMHKDLENLPDTLYKNAKGAVKHEAHEFKEAAGGIKAVLKGGKMSKAQMHAVKVVAFDVALTVATAAVTGGFGLGAGGLAAKSLGNFAKAFAKKIALKSITDGLHHATTVEELHHFSHGLHHTFEHLLTASDKEGDESDLITAYVTKLVADELADLDPETMAEALEEAAKEAT